MAEFHRKTRGIVVLHRCLLNAWVNEESHCWKLNLAVPDDSAVHQAERTLLRWHGYRRRRLFDGVLHGMFLLPLFLIFLLIDLLNDQKTFGVALGKPVMTSSLY